MVQVLLLAVAGWMTAFFIVALVLLSSYKAFNRGGLDGANGNPRKMYRVRFLQKSYDAEYERECFNALVDHF